MEYQLFNEFVQTFLVERKDFLSGSGKVVLTPERLEESIFRFISNQISGSDKSFAEKQAIQFADASDEVRIVFAHAVWLYVHPNKGNTSRGKKAAVMAVVEGIPSYAPREGLFLDKGGIANGGTAYGTTKPNNLRFIILLFKWILGSRAGLGVESIKKAIIACCLYASYGLEKYLSQIFQPEQTRQIIQDLNTLRTQNGMLPRLGIVNYLLNFSDPDYYERLVSHDEKALMAKNLFKPEFVEDDTLDVDALNTDDKIYWIAKHYNSEYPDLLPECPLRDPRIMPLYQNVKQPRKTDNLGTSSKQGSKRYWIYTPGNNGDKWDEFHAQGIMAIGWDELGDLSQFATKEEMELRLRELSGQNQVKKTNDALANWQFKHEIGIGDIILAKKGQTVFLGYGEVISDFQYDPDRTEYRKFREVRWIKKGEWEMKPPHLVIAKTLTDITGYPTSHPNYRYYQELALAVIKGEYPPIIKPPVTQSSHPLNQILFGPPGTGKTYNSVNLAVEIADPGFMRVNRTREQITLRYRELVDEGGIVFTTFHQSMSYEDFIEGIKPVTYQNNHGSIGYEVVDGIFKRLCKAAAKFPSRHFHKTAPTTRWETQGVSQEQFNNLFDTFLMTLPVDDGTTRSEVILSTVRNSTFEVFRSATRPSVVVRAGDMRTPSIVSKNELANVLFNGKKPSYKSYGPVLIDKILEMKKGFQPEPTTEDDDEVADTSLSFEEAYTELREDLATMPETVMKVKTPNGTEFGISLNSKGNLTVHTAPAFRPGVTLTRENILAHARGGEVPPYDKGYFQGVLNLLAANYGYEASEQTVPPVQTASTPLPHVLIIDEINRGNVSQIFGELITLIEPDKRSGQSEALETVLPYSKEKFSVPANLFIIGTMNTADRSVEALDTALRRRFSFREMKPEYGLLAGHEESGIPLDALLRTINLRIEGILDKDHAIGHSYFLRVARRETSLKEVFFNEIIPLLQEYFYGNFGRIELVLGSGFVKSAPVTQDSFALPSPDNEAFSDHTRYSLVTAGELDDAAFAEALRVLMKESDEA